MSSLITGFLSFVLLVKMSGWGTTSNPTLFADFSRKEMLFHFYLLSLQMHSAYIGIDVF